MELKHLKQLKRSLQGKGWDTLKQLFGDPPELVSARASLEEGRRQLHALEVQAQARHAEAEQRRAAQEEEIHNLREERLRWMAKESGTRKELQECQERGKELLEQVVRLTHQERLTKQTLIDQQFKTTTTPLERNRFEMELTEARNKVKEAEERAKKAEERAARARDLERQVQRLKQVESDMAWAMQQATAHRQALGAAIVRIRELEAAVPAPKKTRRSYRRPALRPASPDQREAY
jgi:chromosome segregation ATPase